MLNARLKRPFTSLRSTGRDVARRKGLETEHELHLWNMPHEVPAVRGPVMVISHRLTVLWINCVMIPCFQASVWAVFGGPSVQ